MPNRHRGEIEAEIGGARRCLVLTLGALAELEASFGADDLVALAERFGGGRLTARDLVRIIGAGLRGAGADVSDEEVAAMTTPAPGSSAASSVSVPAVTSRTTARSTRPLAVAGSCIWSHSQGHPKVASKITGVFGGNCCSCLHMASRSR